MPTLMHSALMTRVRSHPIELLTLSPLLLEWARQSSRSRQPAGGLQPTGTQYELYKTSPPSIGIPRRSCDTARSAATDRNGCLSRSFYTPDGHSKGTFLCTIVSVTHHGMGNSNGLENLISVQ
ncbi:hypothetical protein EDD15DRAFT_2196945 [Pisolithus albus]|nr:hypothetical protein EDD15DRAFT_2196945 [Pisolithus albus]